jgi:hypothetical protein
MMDRELEERVARAICFSRQDGVVGVDGDCCQTPAECTCWEHFTDYAKAAIRAMQPAPLPVVRFKEGERDV